VTSPFVGLAVVAAVLVAATAFGFLRRRRDGRLRAVSSTVDLALFGVTRGTPVTLVQFSSEFCAPCRATSALCASLAASRPDVTHVEVDVADHLGVVRALDIRRTPTLLVVDAAGTVVSRAVGKPSREELLSVVGSTS
jgi:thiol-disulfide isomerase/thioredoxin